MKPLVRFTASLVLGILLLPAAAQATTLGHYTAILSDYICRERPSETSAMACMEYLHYRFDQRYDKGAAELACTQQYCKTVPGPLRNECRSTCAAMAKDDN